MTVTDQTAQAGRFTAAYEFGDSRSGAGNVYVATGALAEPMSVRRGVQKDVGFTHATAGCFASLIRAQILSEYLVKARRIQHPQPPFFQSTCLRNHHARRNPRRQHAESPLQLPH